MKTNALLTRQRTQLDSTSREAEGYLELGMPRQAVTSLERRGKLVHDDARACFLLGESLRELERFDDAVRPLRRSLALSPDTPEVWLALGWCAKRLGRLDEAVRALEAGLRSVPQHPLLHYNLACYYSLAGRRLDAVRRLHVALKHDASLRGLVEDETDFEPMRDDPALRMLLAAPL